MGHDYYLVYELDTTRSQEYTNIPGLNRGNKNKEVATLRKANIIERIGPRHGGDWVIIYHHELK